MTRATNLCLLALVTTATPPTFGFVVVRSRIPTLRLQATQHQTEEKDEVAERVSDAYWMEQMEQDKGKLHRMMSSLDYEKATSDSVENVWMPALTDPPLSAPTSKADKESVESVYMDALIGTQKKDTSTKPIAVSMTAERVFLDSLLNPAVKSVQGKASADSVEGVYLASLSNPPKTTSHTSKATGGAVESVYLDSLTDAPRATTNAMAASDSVEHVYMASLADPPKAVTNPASRAAASSVENVYLESLVESPPKPRTTPPSLDEAKIDPEAIVAEYWSRLSP